MFNEFPNTNFHELNMDWVIAQIKALNERLTKGIAEEVAKQISTLFVTGQYDEATETLTIKIEKEV